MNIDEKIQEVKNELKKILIESIESREELMQKLEQIGLDRKIIENLMEAFIQAEDAKNTVKSVWRSDTRIDSSIDVETYQQQQTETRKRLEDIIDASSILIILNKTDIKEVDEEIWQRLYTRGIDESKIINPILSQKYKEYVERTERENNPDTLKLKGLLSKVGKQAAILKQRCGELQKENDDLKAENERLKRENEELKRANKYIETKFKARIVSDEKNYQAALTQIKTLKRELRREQNKGVFQTIGAKLFGNRHKELPEPNAEIPTTLYESIVEEVEAKSYDKRAKSEAESDKKVSKSERTNDDEEFEI